MERNSEEFVTSSVFSSPLTNSGGEEGEEEEEENEAGDCVEVQVIYIYIYICVCVCLELTSFFFGFIHSSPKPCSELYQYAVVKSARLMCARAHTLHFMFRLFKSFGLGETVSHSFSLTNVAWWIKQEH